MASFFFVQDVLIGAIDRTGANGENLSPPTTGQHRVSVVKHHFSSLFFLLNEPIAGTLRHAYKKIAPTFEDLTA